MYFKVFEIVSGFSIVKHWALDSSVFEMCVFCLSCLVFSWLIVLQALWLYCNLNVIKKNNKNSLFIQNKHSHLFLSSFKLCTTIVLWMWLICRWWCGTPSTLFPPVMCVWIDRLAWMLLCNPCRVQIVEVRCLCTRLSVNPAVPSVPSPPPACVHMCVLALCVTRMVLCKCSVCVCVVLLGR